jgi:hypothetical protein
MKRFPSQSDNDPGRSVLQARKSLDTDKWAGYINISLNHQHKQEFEAWVKKDPSLGWMLIDELLGSGVKVSISYDAEADSYCCTLTGRLVTGDQGKYGMSTWASTFDECLQLAAWKFCVLHNGDLNDSKPKSGKNSRWG